MMNPPPTPDAPAAGPPCRPQRRPRAAGFTLVEVLVSFTVLLLILLGVFTLFDRNQRVARAQTHIADLQQAVRVSQQQLTRTVRMAGRGAMPMFQTGPSGVPGSDGYWLPNGVAAAVRNNVPAGGRIAPGDSGSPLIAEDSDVLTVRGVIEGSLYQLVSSPASFTNDGSGNGAIVVPALSPTGVPQDLDRLCDQLTDDDGNVLPVAMVVVSPISDVSYVVVQVEDASSCPAEGSPELTVRYTTSGDPAASYLALSPGGGFPAEMTAAAFVGVLDEFRYYVRQEEDLVTDLTELVPGADFLRRLSRARVYPGTDTPRGGTAASLREDLADNIIDLQVALGIEDATDADDVVSESISSPGEDEWLFNSSADDATDVCRWNLGGAGCASAEPQRLYYLRITTLGRGDRPENGWNDPVIEAIEDHVYGETNPPSDSDERNQRLFRRWALTSTVDLRNL